MAEIRGSTYETRTGVGIRWREGERRRFHSGFRTKTEARDWSRENVAPRLNRGAPSAEITFDDFCELFLTRHTGAPRTVETLRDRLRPARETFGDWRLSELEHAAADVAAWRSRLPEGSRYRLTNALRQAFAAAVRWRYITRNPAVDMGVNPQPRTEEIEPFTVEQVDVLAAELGPVYGPMVVFVAETGLRTNEFVALSRRDVDRDALAHLAPSVNGEAAVFGPFDTVDEDLRLSTFRTIGHRKTGQANPPLVHAKLALIGYLWWHDEDELGSVDDVLFFRPLRLWISSANFTVPSRLSLEFGFWTEDPVLLDGAQAFLCQLIASSESLDALSDQSDPELRPVELDMESFAEYAAEVWQPDHDEDDEP